jgi:acetyl-CoA acetyltransferase
MPLAADAAVIGIGATPYTRGSDKTEWQLANEAISAALNDAHVETSEVDGLLRSTYDHVDEAMVVRTFDFTLTHYGQVGYGGLGTPALLGHAAAAIAGGQADVVVCYRSLNGYSGTRYGRAERSLETTDQIIARGDRAPSGAFAAPYGLLAPGNVMAMWARRYQYEYGLTDEQLSTALGSIAVQQREYAQANPNAIMCGRPLTMDGYLGSRLISDPLRLNDYALESDGACALVVASAEIARTRERPVWITGSQQGLFRYAESISIYGEPRNGPRYRALGRRLFETAGLTPGDMSSALLYDATTVTTLLALETYEFCPVGRAWSYVTEEGIGLDSPLPVNTNGGLLSEAYVHYANQLLEGVRQCRGTATSQVRDVRHVLCASGPTAVILTAADAL